MKKNIALILSVLLVLVFCFTACTNPNTPNTGETQENTIQYEIFKLAKADGFDGTYEEWLNSIKGKDGVNGKEVELAVVNEKICWKYKDELQWRDLCDVANLKGVKGEDGKSAYEIYKSKHPDYTGTEEQWINDLVSGNNNQNITHTVTFDTNGGSELTNSTQKVKHLDKIIKPVNPTRVGYKFGGWYLNDEQWLFGGCVVTEDITLVAKWINTGENYIYDYNNGGITITGYVGNETNLVIPDSIDDKPVKVIGLHTDYSSKSNPSVQSIVLPNLDIEVKGINLFPNLETITIPNKVSRINFNWISCNKFIIDSSHPKYKVVDGNIITKDTLTLVYANKNSSIIPEGIKVIDSWVYSFDREGIKNIVLPDSLEEIKDSAFCNGIIESIHINKNLKKIGNHPFIQGDLENPNTKIYVDDIKTLINLSINNTGSLGVPDYIFSSDGSAVLYVNGVEVNDVVIPEGVKIIKACTLSEFCNINSIQLPSTLETIEKFAIFTKQSEIYIPVSVKIIGKCGIISYRSVLKTINCGASSRPSGWDENAIYVYDIPEPGPINPQIPQFPTYNWNVQPK